MGRRNLRRSRRGQRGSMRIYRLQFMIATETTAVATVPSYEDMPIFDLLRKVWRINWKHDVLREFLHFSKEGRQTTHIFKSADFQQRRIIWEGCSGVSNEYIAPGAPSASVDKSGETTEFGRRAGHGGSLKMATQTVINSHGKKSTPYVYSFVMSSVAHKTPYSVGSKSTLATRA